MHCALFHFTWVSHCTARRLWILYLKSYFWAVLQSMLFSCLLFNLLISEWQCLKWPLTLKWYFFKSFGLLIRMPILFPLPSSIQKSWYSKLSGQCSLLNYYGSRPKSAYRQIIKSWIVAVKFTTISWIIIIMVGILRKNGKTLSVIW